MNSPGGSPSSCSIRALIRGFRSLLEGAPSSYARKMAEPKLSKSGSIVGGSIEIPELPPDFVAEFRVEREGEEDVQTRDQLFDLAFDFVHNHETHGPFAEQLEYGEDTDEFYALEEQAVELGREWAYALLVAIGEPYRSKTDELKRSLMPED